MVEKKLCGSSLIGLNMNLQVLEKGRGFCEPESVFVPDKLKFQNRIALIKNYPSFNI